MSREARFGHLTYQEIRYRAEEGDLAIVPTGCTEQQGPHLLVDFDTWFAETLMLAAAEKALPDYGVRALVLPVIPFGPTPEHRGYGSGYIDIPKEVHEMFLGAVLDSLAEQGFRKIVVWRGCGGHDLTSTVEAFNEAHKGQCKADLPELPYREIWCRVGDPSVPGGHADSFSTSIALYLRPEAVRRELIPAAQSASVDWGDPDLDFTRYSPTGVIGDPTRASAELGEKLWEAVVEAATLILKEVSEE